MQWLIDIVKEWIEAQGYLKQSYISNPDFAPPFIPAGGWIVDGSWNVADVSDIVPTNATAINVAWKYRADGIGGVIYIRPVGHVGFADTCIARTYVANIDHNTNIPISLDTNKQFEYRFIIGFAWLTAFRIRGWWL